MWQEFSGEDNGDLYLEERDQAIQRAQMEKHRLQLNVPGIIGPHDLPEEMQDWFASSWLNVFTAWQCRHSDEWSCVHVYSNDDVVDSVVSEAVWTFCSVVFCCFCMLLLLYTLCIQLNQSTDWSGRSSHKWPIMYRVGR